VTRVEVLRSVAAKLRSAVIKSHAVDFDGTIAEAPKEWRGPGYVGAPVPEMIEQIKQWIAAGEEVKILTARMASSNPESERRQSEQAIRQFLVDNLGDAGKDIVITAEKDPGMEDITDDKAVAVDPAVEKGDHTMPEPKQNESEQDFVSRCVPEVMREGADQQAALGKCYGIYRNANKAVGTVDTMSEASEHGGGAAMGRHGLGDVQAAEDEHGVPEDNHHTETTRNDVTSVTKRILVKTLGAVVKCAILAKSITVSKSESVDPTELYEGTLEEMEHTDDWRIAMQIALDHLAETPDYYRRLAQAGLMGEQEPRPTLEAKPPKNGVTEGDATTLSSDN